jgi:hypothetical protein
MRTLDMLSRRPSVRFTLVGHALARHAPIGDAARASISRPRFAR